MPKHSDVTVGSQVDVDGKRTPIVAEWLPGSGEGITAGYADIYVAGAKQATLDTSRLSPEPDSTQLDHVGNANVTAGYAQVLELSGVKHIDFTGPGRNRVTIEAGYNNPQPINGTIHFGPGGNRVLLSVNDGGYLNVNGTLNVIGGSGRDILEINEATGQQMVTSRESAQIAAHPLYRANEYTVSENGNGTLSLRSAGDTDNQIVLSNMEVLRYQGVDFSLADIGRLHPHNTPLSDIIAKIKPLPQH